MEPSTISVGSMGTGSGGGYSHTPTFRTTIINVVRIESQVLEKDIIQKNHIIQKLNISIILEFIVNGLGLIQSKMLSA